MHKVKMFIRFFILYTIIKSINFENVNKVTIDDPSSILACEPNIKEFENVERWKRIFNIGLIPMGWLTGLSIISKEIIEERTMGNLENEVGVTDVHRHISGVDVYKRNYSGPMSRLFNTVIFHFLHGDAFILHLFDEEKLSYTKVELGFHTQKFTVVLPPGVWFAVDVKMHKENIYTLAGWTVIYTGNNSSFPVANERDMIRKFPQQADLITELTSR